MCSQYLVTLAFVFWTETGHFKMLPTFLFTLSYWLCTDANLFADWIYKAAQSHPTWLYSVYERRISTTCQQRVVMIHYYNTAYLKQQRQREASCLQQEYTYNAEKLIFSFTLSTLTIIMLLTFAMMQYFELMDMILLVTLNHMRQRVLPITATE